MVKANCLIKVPQGSCILTKVVVRLAATGVCSGIVQRDINRLIAVSEGRAVIAKPSVDIGPFKICFQKRGHKRERGKRERGDVGSKTT